MQYKILVLNPDQKSASLYRQYLQHQNISVNAVPDLDTALSLLKKGEYDLLIADFTPSESNLSQLIKSASDTALPIPIIALVDSIPSAFASFSLDQNILYFLPKSFACADLIKETVFFALRFKQYRQERERLLEILIDAYRLPKFGTIITGVAHNLNSPLASVIGYAQLAKLKNPELKNLDLIENQALKISQALSALSKKGQADLDAVITEIDLNDLIQKELEFLKYNLFFKHSITVNLNLHKIPNFKGVYHHFTQIFHHLVQNALDAMFSLEVKELSLSTDFINPNIHFTLTDTGEGIPPENLDKIFHLGFTTRPAPTDIDDPDLPNGYGIGLFIVKNLLQKYGAKIEIESELGKGTAVRIVIPV